MKTQVLVAALAGLSVAASAGAASITASGSDIDTGGDLTSAGLGETVTGSIQWDFTGGTPQVSQDLLALASQQRNNLPAGVTFGVGANTSGVAGGWGYQQVTDDFGGPFESGTLTSGGTTPAEIALLTIGAGGPTDIRLGLYTDNTDNPVFTPGSFDVAVGGASASVSTTSANLDGDVYWFDVTGLVDGDVISITVDGSTSENLLGGIITAEVPEPGSLALIGLGGLAMLRRRR